MEKQEYNQRQLDDPSVHAGAELDFEHTERLIAAIRKKYAPLRIFGAVQVLFSSLSIFGFVYQFEMFQAIENLIAKFIATFFTFSFLCGYFWLAWALFSFSKDLEKNVRDGDFKWLTGTVTGKYRNEQGHRENDGRYHQTRYVYVDCVKYNAILPADYDAAQIGDRFLVVCLKKNGLTYAMQYHERSA